MAEPNNRHVSQFKEEYNGSAGSKCEMMLRLIPAALCIAAVIIVFKSSQTSSFGTVTYASLSALRYFVAINVLSAGYSLLTAVVVAFPGIVSMARAWCVFLLDQTLTLLILGAGSMTAEALYLMKNGDDVAGWSEACGSFGRFCDKTEASVAITFSALVCYVLLCSVSSYKLFSLYDPPSQSLCGRTTVVKGAMEQ